MSLCLAALLAAPLTSCSDDSGPQAPAASGTEAATGVPAPPDPEPIEVVELPLPPVAPSDEPGACTPQVNPNRTGCISRNTQLQAGGFLPDGRHVLALVGFVGAPAAPDPASSYTGDQLIAVKTDGSTFPDGDAWKCLTCGVPAENAVGRTEGLDYPQAFRDGRRVLAGTNIIECGEHQLVDEACTPDQVHIYPLHWTVTADGSGESGRMRELRLHPDNVHIGFSSFTVTGGKLGQFSYFGRLQFNPSPTSGIPATARYDVVNVTRLFDPSPQAQPIVVDPDNPGELRVNYQAPSVGELRGFSGDGREVTYIGHPHESSNWDLFAADLTTGKVRRLTSHPEYVDPADLSPADNSIVIMDTRGSDRQMFLAGMRGIPPITDLVSTSATSSTRNNGQRRFFQPYLLDPHGDRGDYFGQQVNGAGDGSPGSVNDPNWTGRADPKWSPDGTQIVYWQALVVPPACGGANPLPCPTSTAEGGRTARLMLATLTSREPTPPRQVEPVPDEVPWGTPYVPGSEIPTRPYPEPGTYTLRGQASGSARVELVENAEGTALETVEVTYTDYSDDGVNVLNGTERVSARNINLTTTQVDWFSDLTRTGEVEATKKTSPDGFHLTIDVLTNIFQATGTLTTTIDGKEYRQPANGT